MWVTVVELEEFQRRAKGLLSDAERTELIDAVAANPLLGVSLGGGLRKWRFARSGGGKSGGYRVVHYFAPTGGGPVFLLTVFAKNEKADLSPREAEALAALTRTVAERHGRRG
jgi:hypothetical protein